MNSTGRPSRIAPKMASTRGGKVEGCVAFFTADLGARVAETRATGASGTASASLGTLVFAGALVAGLALGSAASAFLGAAFFAGAGLALVAGFSTSGVESVGFLRGDLVTAMGLWLLAHHRPYHHSWSMPISVAATSAPCGHAGRMGHRNLRFAAVMGLHTFISAGTFLFGKTAADAIPTLALGLLRFLIAGAGFLILARLRHLELWTVARAEWRAYLLAGFLGVTLNQLAFLSGLAFTLPSHAALLYALT